MKLTKKILNEHGIHNSWDIAKLLSAVKFYTIIYVDYVPADNGRLTARYAYWNYTRFAEGKVFTKDFTVTCRENKQPVFEQAVKFIKDKFGIDITDKDPFGAYHPKDTLEKLTKLIESEDKE